MVGRLLWEQDAAGSSPVTSTKTPNLTFRLGLEFLFCKIFPIFLIYPFLFRELYAIMLLSALVNIFFTKKGCLIP